MRKILVAFDCDGTLIKNSQFDINDRIVDLLKILSTFKNIKIIVWSGQGKNWADEVVKELNIASYVWKTASKNHKGKIDGKHIFEPDFIPDIAIDDIQACALGLINLIVKEK